MQTAVDHDLTPTGSDETEIPLVDPGADDPGVARNDAITPEEAERRLNAMMERFITRCGENQAIRSATISVIIAGTTPDGEEIVERLDVPLRDLVPPEDLDDDPVGDDESIVGGPEADMPICVTCMGNTNVVEPEQTEPAALVEEDGTGEAEGAAVPTVMQPLVDLTIAVGAEPLPEGWPFHDVAIRNSDLEQKRLPADHAP